MKQNYNLPLPSIQRSPISTIAEDIQELNKNTSITPHERWLRYAELFSRFFAVAHDLFMSLNPTATENNPTVENRVEFVEGKSNPTTDLTEIASRLYKGKKDNFSKFNILVNHTIQSIPPTLRKKATQLLQLLAEQNEMTTSNGRFGFNDQGNLVTQNRSLIGTNFFDLLHYSIRKRPSKSKPAGFSVFRKILYDLNIPTELTSFSKQLPHAKQWEAVEETLPQTYKKQLKSSD